MVGADKDALSIEEFLWKFTPLLLLIDHCRDAVALRLLGNLFDQLSCWRQIENRFVSIVHNGLNNKQANERFPTSGMQLNDEIAFSFTVIPRPEHLGLTCVQVSNFWWFRQMPEEFNGIGYRLLRFRCT